MTAAKVMDIISRLQGCSGQAADAVSAYTPVKMENASKLLKIPKSECPDMWIRLPRHKWPKSWSSMEDPVVLLDRNLYGHPWAGPLLERQFEKVLLEHGWETVSNWECLFVNQARGVFLSVYVDDIKLAGKTENKEPTWKILMKDVDLGEPISFLDHVYLGCTQKEMSDKQRYCRQLQEYVRIQDLCWGFRKAALFRETWSKHFLMVLWHGRSCKEMRGKILRTGEQNNSTVLRSRNSMCWRPSIQGRTSRICWWVVKSMLTICTEMPVFGSNW